MLTHRDDGQAHVGAEPVAHYSGQETEHHHHIPARDVVLGIPNNTTEDELRGVMALALGVVVDEQGLLVW